MKAFLLLALFFFAPSLHAQELKSQDEISVEIRTLSKEALESLRGFDSDIDVMLNKIEAQLPSLKAYLSDEKLIATTRNTEQISIALNFPQLGLILFDRIKWPKILNRNMQRAIAMHEALSLMGLEGTGFYMLSHTFLQSTGLTVAQLQQAIAGAPATTARGDGVTCEWIGDRSHLQFELWSQALETCSLNGGQQIRTFKILEAQLQEMISLAQAKCTGDRKVYSVSSKMQTLIGTLKASAPASCTR